LVAYGKLSSDRDDELPELCLALRVDDLDHRVQLLVAILSDHELPPPGRLVQLLADGLLLDDVDEANDSFEVRHDRLRVRIPAEEQVADLDVLLILDGDHRAVRHTEPRADDSLGSPHQ